MNSKSRSLMALISTFLLLMPYFVLLKSGDSLFLMFWEFAANRYFQALNIIAEDYQSIWIVQGIPMQIAQVWILKAMLFFDANNAATPVQLELFSKFTVLMAFLLTAIVLSGSWWIKTLHTSDRISMLLILLALFPVTRWHHYLFAPEYWINELPFYTFSSLWTIVIIRRYIVFDTLIPKIPTLVLSGLWLALCFSQKPSLVGFGALPIILQLTLGSRKFFSFFCDLAILGISTIAGYIFISGLLFNLHWEPTKNFIINNLRWLVLSPTYGTSHINYSVFFEKNYVLNYPILISVIFLFITYLLCILDNQRRILNIFYLFFIYILLITFGHILVIYLRPSGTSFIDFTLFATLVMPICFAFLNTNKNIFIYTFSHNKLASLSIGWVISIILVGLFSIFPTPPSAYSTVFKKDTQKELITSILLVSDYIKSLRRPAILVIGDNRSQPRTMESLALYTGQLGLMGSERSPQISNPPILSIKNKYRQNLIGDIIVVGSPGEMGDFLKSAIVAGQVIIWGSFDDAPKTEDAYPQLNVFNQNINAVVQSFLMEPGGHRTVHIAYIDTPIIKPLAPNKIKAERISSSEIRVSWSAILPEAFFRIFLKIDNEPYKVVATLNNKNEYIAQGLPLGSTYYFRIQTQTGVIVSELSPEILAESKISQ